MTNEQHDVKTWMQNFGQETPDKPVIPSLEVRKLRAKLELEECLETCLALGIHVKFYHPSLPTVHWICSEEDIKRIEYHRGDEPNLVAIADGCEDQKVVVEGTLVACGLLDTKFKCSPGGELTERDPLFDEVMRSNWSKFWTNEEIAKLAKESPDLYKSYNIERDFGKEKFLVKDKDGKVIKSPSFSAPKLEPIIEEMRK